MSLNTTLRVLYKGQRHDVYPKTTIAKVDGLSSRLSTIESDVSTNTTSIGALNTSISSLSSRMTTAEGSITSLQSGKADKEHTHEGSQIYVKSEEVGDTLDEWATSIEDELSELSDLVGGSQGETWVIDEDISFNSFDFDVDFTSNNTEYVRLKGWHDQFDDEYYDICYLTYYETISPYKATDVYSYVYDYDSSPYIRDRSWIDEAYRTVTFETAPTGDLLTWLEANAVKVVNSLSSRMTTAEGSITSLQSGKADKEHTHVGSQIYVKSEEVGDTLNVWATSIEDELSDLAGGLQYEGVFTTDATLQALLEATTSKAGSYFVYNGSSAYTIPASLGGKTITIVYGDDGSSTERVIEKNDYVVLNEKLAGEYKISIINNTHGSATTSKEGLVKLATGASTGNEVITASVLNAKDYQPAGSYAVLANTQTFTGINTFSNDVLLNHTASGKKVQINIGQQGLAKIVVNPDGNPEQSTTTFLLTPTYAGGNEIIIHTGNISSYTTKGMPLLTSAQESSFTDENVIYAVLDA